MPDQPFGRADAGGPPPENDASYRESAATGRFDGGRTRTGGVVVPAVDAASSVACLRSLGRRGVETVAVSESRTAPGFSSRYCDGAVLVPDPAEDLDGYGEALLSVAERYDAGTVVPVREADVYALAKRRERFAERTATPWPSFETLRLAQDRVELFDVAAEAGVPHPDTALLTEWDRWELDIVVKPRYTVPAPEYVGRGNCGSSLGSTQYVEPDGKLDIAAIIDEMGHVPIVQEFVPGPNEYGFFALCDRGDVVATFQHRQRRAYKYCGGPSAYRESVSIPALETAGRRLLEAMDWHGVAMVEFLRNDETGEFELMEVNPRFWSSLPFTIQAGVDFPYLYWLRANGQEFGSDPEYAVEVGGHLLRGELLYLHSVLFEKFPLVERPSPRSATYDVISSLVRHPRFDYLSRDDPRPFVRDLRNAVEAALDRL